MTNQSREERIVLPHQRHGAEPSTPAARLIELGQTVERQRQQLVEAEATIKLLKKDAEGRTSVQICASHEGCKVCELTVDENGLSAPVVSQRTWIFVPCSSELLEICLYCGNVVRERRME